MIGPLRARHRRIFLVLSIGLPLLVVAGVFVRTPIPTSGTAGGIAPDSTGDNRKVHEDEHSWSELGITIRIFESESDMYRGFVELEIADNLEEPDVLLYWNEKLDRGAAASGSNTAVPDSAYLLGSIPGPGRHHFDLPHIASDLGGALFLYSLAHQRMLESVALPTRTDQSGDE